MYSTTLADWAVCVYVYMEREREGKRERERERERERQYESERGGIYKFDCVFVYGGSVRKRV